MRREHREPPIGAVMTTITLAVAHACQRVGVSLGWLLFGSVLATVPLTLRYELWRRKNP